MEPLAEHLARRVAGAVAAVDSLRSQLDVVEQLAGAVATTLGQGAALFTCGNGGSAAQAAHLSEELTGKYSRPRPPLRAVCLCADAAALTCIANDFGYERVFSRQLEALARRGDALLVLSTSGASPNVVEALRAARRLGATTLGLLGKDGGRALPLCDAALVVASDDTAHIQEAHQVALHLILETVERSLS